MKNSCVNKEGSDKYVGKVELDPELEKTFKRRMSMENIDEAVLDAAEEEMGDEKAMKGMETLAEKEKMKQVETEKQKEDQGHEEKQGEEQNN